MTSNTELKKRPTRQRRPQRAALPASSSGEALYRQVVQVLKDEIVRGVYPVGSQLPTEEELCARFSVSRYTIREALRRLREDRLVASRQGAGTTVIPFDPSDADLHQVTSINDLVTFAVGLRFDIESMEMITADAALAERIGGAIGERWLVVRGYRQSDQSPLPACWAEVFVNEEFAGVGRLLKRNRGPIFHLIEDLFGQRIDEVQQQISASIIPASMARGLKVEPNSVALDVQRTYRLTSGKIALVAINIHPAERFRHTMTIRRVKG
jgi:DNA-binding GntR family transcriptional regulator